jgi:hypothetical protein
MAAKTTSSGVMMNNPVWCAYILRAATQLSVTCIQTNSNYFNINGWLLNPSIHDAIWASSSSHDGVSYKGEGVLRATVEHNLHEVLAERIGKL